MKRSLQSWCGIETLHLHAELRSSRALVDLSDFVVLREYASFYRLDY